MDNQVNNNTTMSELNNLVNMIVDYYCFKNNIFDDDQEEDEKWKKGTKYDNPSEEIIPEKIDVLIEKVFIHQLNKFSKDK
jgi:hypothetical protein